MNILDIQQGTQEWLDLRAKHFTASEASSALGASKYQTRNELLALKATGAAQDVTPAVQRLFDQGHAAEAAARPIAEGIIGEDLFPATVTEEIDGIPLLASLDGMTMAGDVLFEHKLANQQLMTDINNGKLDRHYTIQLEQQLLVSGAEKVLFMCSDGSEERCAWCWYVSSPDLRAEVVAGWKQFADDLNNYSPEAVTPEVTGKAPDSLPALRIELTGMVKASNLTEFKGTAMAVIDAVSTDLQTDSDFADAEKAVKWCKDVEARLVAAKDHALGQTASIDELFRTLDEIREEARAKRLDLEKLVKARKQTIRDEILMGSKKAFADHIESINASLGGKIRLPEIAVDFAGAMKGKKTVASLRDAVDTELARVKIESNQIADSVRLNIETLRVDAVGYEALFADAQQLVVKANDDLKNLIVARINEHKAEEEKRLTVERERIRAEEEAKAKAAAEEEIKEATTEVVTKKQDDISPASKPAEKKRPATQERSFNISIATDKADDEIIKIIGDALSANGIRASIQADYDRAA